MSTRDFTKLAEVLTRLAATIESRRGQDPKSSYTAKMLAKGPEGCAKKLGEEAVETALAAVTTSPEDRAHLVSESADLLFHLNLLWEVTGVTPDEVAQELTRREGVSGIAEKAARGE